MHLLAVDFGSKRIGLAWADTTLGVVLPYGLIEEETLTKKVKALSDLIKAERIDQVVIGFPTSLDGSENKNTERIQKFVFELQKQITAPIVYADERFSSQAADSLGGGVSRDEKSAMIILEGYQERLKHTKK